MILAVNLTERLSSPHHNHNGQSSKSPWGKESAPQGHSWESRSARGPARAPLPTNSPPELLLHLNCIENISAQKSAYLYWRLFSGDLALNDRRPIKDLDACDLWDCGPLVPAPRLLAFSLASSPAVGTIVEHIHHDWHPLSVTSQFNHLLKERSATIYCPGSWCTWCYRIKHGKKHRPRKF